MAKIEKNSRQQRLKEERFNLFLKSLMAILFVTGAIIFSYPFVADAINNFHDQLVIDQYQKEMTKQFAKEQQKRQREMKEENAKLLAEKKTTNIPGMGLVEDPFEEAVKDAKTPGKAYFQEHTIGAIFIPAIHVSLPIFDETNNELLDKGATVLQGTSYPIGGESTHSVITGHSGLPDKMLFTDLEKLKKGDLFYIEVAGEKLAYKVDRFKTVLPTELEDLKIEEGKDLVTLLTCTPYMVNTHRLLVTGVRVPFVEDEMEKQITKAKDYHLYRMAAFAVAIPLFFFLIFYWMWRKFAYYQCIKHQYDFEFFVMKNGEPIVGAAFYAINKRDKQVVEVNGEKRIVTSDELGKVSFKNLPGGKYSVYPVVPKQFPKVFGYVRSLKDKYFTLKSKRSLMTVSGKRHHKQYVIRKR